MTRDRGYRAKATVARRNHSRIAPALSQPELSTPAVGRSPIVLPQVPARPPTRVAKPVDATPHGYGPGRRCRCSRSRPPLFAVAGVASPDLRHRDLPSLQFNIQPLLHRLPVQQRRPHRPGHGQPMQRGVGDPHALGLGTHHPFVGIYQAGQRYPNAQLVPPRRPAPVTRQARPVPSPSGCGITSPDI